MWRISPALTVVLAVGPVSDGLSAAAQSGQTELGDWVVKSVVHADAFPGHNTAWTYRLPVGDIRSDGQMDMLFAGGGVGFTALHWADGWAGSSFDTAFGSGSMFLAGGWDQLYATLLARPSGLSLVALSSSYQHVFLDVASGQTLGQLTFPPPPLPSLPVTNSFSSIVRAGDVNGDGWDDAFGQVLNGAYAVAGLIDGRTMSVKWLHYLPDQGGLSPTVPLTLDGWPDVDSDGLPDMIHTSPRYYPATATWEATAEALDGETGAVHWSSTLPGVGFATGRMGPDINADGVADIVFLATESGDIYLLDGATGNVIWHQSIGVAAPLLPPLPDLSLESVAGMSSVPGSVGVQVIVKTLASDPVSGSREQGLLHVDAASGSIVAYHDISGATLAPWLQDPASFTDRYSAFIGDIDRDGVAELGVSTPTPSLDVPFVPGTSFSQVIWSMATLSVPRKVSIGQQIHWDLHLPGASGLTAVVLVSETFDAVGGKVINGWPTSLGIDQVLRWSSGPGATSPPLLVSLDAVGAGSRQFSLPPNSGLIGRTFFSKAIVPSPSVPGEILTSSSLGVTTVVP